MHLPLLSYASGISSVDHRLKVLSDPSTHHPLRDGSVDVRRQAPARHHEAPSPRELNKERSPRRTHTPHGILAPGRRHPHRMIMSKPSRSLPPSPAKQTTALRPPTISAQAPAHVGSRAELAERTVQEAVEFTRASSDTVGSTTGATLLGLALATSAASSSLSSSRRLPHRCPLRRPWRSY